MNSTVKHLAICITCFSVLCGACNRDTANLIEGNRATFGAGVQVDASSPRVERNRIIANLAEPRGGGFSCVDAAPLVANNIISGNRSAIAAAAACW